MTGTPASLTCANFGANFARALGLKILPVGIQPSTVPGAPAAIVYDYYTPSDEFNPLTLVSVPAISDTSPLRNALLAPDGSRLETSGNDGSLLAAFNMVQDMADETIAWAAEKTADVILTEARRHIDIVEPDVPGGGGKTMTHAPDAWEHYFKSAILNASVDDVEANRRAVDEFEVAAVETRAGYDVEALIMELATALRFKLKYEVDYSWEARSELIGAWMKTIHRKRVDTISDPLRIAQGILLCLPELQFGMDPFLRHARVLYKGSPEIVAHVHLLQAWRILVTEMERDELTQNDVTDEIKYMGDAVDEMTAASELWERHSEDRARLGTLNRYRQAALWVMDYMEEYKARPASISLG